MGNWNVRSHNTLRKWSLPLLGGVTLTLLAGTCGLSAPRVHAQNVGKVRKSAPVAASVKAVRPANGKPAGIVTHSLSATEKADARIAMIQHLIEDKQGKMDRLRMEIDDRLQTLEQCRLNMQELTDGVNDAGLSHLDPRICRTRLPIAHLRQVMKEQRYQIALGAVEMDGLDRRIVQLKMQIAHELQPDPTRLHSLEKQRDDEVNQRLGGIDPNDPAFLKELEEVSRVRSRWEKAIEEEKALVLNRAAEQGAAAEEWEKSEQERVERLQATDLVAVLRNELLNTPNWKGEMN